MGLALLAENNTEQVHASSFVTILIVIFVILFLVIVAWQAHAHFFPEKNERADLRPSRRTVIDRNGARTPVTNARSPGGPGPGHSPTAPSSGPSPGPAPHTSPRGAEAVRQQVVYSPAPPAARPRQADEDSKFTVILQKMQFPHLGSHTSRDFPVSDQMNHKLFHVSLMKPHPDMWEGGDQIPELLSVQTKDQERDLATCPLFQGKRDCEVEDMNGVRFGMLSQQDARNFVFRPASGGAQDVVVLQGDPAQHNLRVTKGSDVIAECVPGSGATYQVVCQTQSDIGLTCLLLLAVERLAKLCQ
jgi:hypothetical protein